MIDTEKHISSAPLYTYRRPHPRFAKSIAVFAVCLLCFMAFEHAAQAINREEMLNPFVRPNVHSEAYYGSGDADENGVVNWDDLDLMKKEKVSDYTDINDDGITNNQDISILESYLNKDIPYLPGDWNKLETQQEKDEWFTKMYNIDPIGRTSGSLINQGWKCGSFSMQELTNFFGIKDLKTWEQSISNEYNGRFNLPLYIADVGKPGFSHEMNAILVGNDPLIIGDLVMLLITTQKLELEMIVFQKIVA